MRKPEALKIREKEWNDRNKGGLPSSQAFDHSNANERTKGRTEREIKDHRQEGDPEVKHDWSVYGRRESMGEEEREE